MLVVTALLLFPKGLTAQDEQKGRERREPVPETQAQLDARRWVVLVEERNPWIGVDGPTLVLYANGMVIYWKRDEKKNGFFSALLTEGELQRFLDSMEESGAPYRALPDQSIHASTPSVALDASETRISLRCPGRPGRALSAFGGLRHMGTWMSHGRPGDAVLKFLAEYEHPQATDWIPERTLVRLKLAKPAQPGAPVWPASLPGLKEATKVGDSDYVMDLDAIQFLELRKFLDQQTDPKALIDGKEWDLTVAALFPHQVPLLASPARKLKKD